MSPLNIIAAVAIFPLLLPMWEERPIVTDDIYPGPYPVKMEDATVRFAATGFQYGDFVFRQKLAQNLAQTHNRAAAAELLNQLQREPHKDVRATILGQVRLLPYDHDAAMTTVTPLLEAPDRTVRQWAVILYGELNDASARLLLDKALNDSDPQVRHRAAEALLRHVEPLMPSDLQPLRESSDRVLQAWGWAATCHAQGGKHNTAQLEKASGNAPVNVRCAIAEHMFALPPETFATLCKILATDTHPSVRGKTAASIRQQPLPELLPTLLALADDADHEVRRLAVESLVAYPEYAAGAKIVAKYGDPSVFVRQQAEAAAIELHPRFDMADLSAARLADDNPNVRYRAYNLLGSINARQHGQTIGNTLMEEREIRLINAGLLALYKIRDTQFKDFILQLTAHSESSVRTNAVLALSNMRGDRIVAAVHKAVEDPHPDVRKAALLAMGRIADPSFAPVFLKALRSTGRGSLYSSVHRNIACWASGKLPTLPEDLAQRLVTQATKPVIPVMGMMIFEPDYVLVSACWALAESARKDPAMIPLAEKVIQIHSRDPSGDAEWKGPGELNPSAELREYARQAEAYMHNRPVEAGRRPTRTIHLVYSEAD